jgi:ubiquinone/menaquinone biosynthesis C-methylase UbiE
MSDYLALWRYWRQGARAFARDDFRIYQEDRQRLAAYLGEPVVGKRMLDIGCGQHYPETLLYHNDGNQITGIDLDVVGVGPSVRKYTAIVHQNGAKRALKGLVRELLFDPAYYGELAAQYGRPLSHRGVDLRSADATALPFADNEFDLVVSTNAFEHIADLDAAARETARVLKPGGLAHIDFHLYTSLSGGHHLEWTWPEREQERVTPPWDHLRQNAHAVDYFLNKQRMSAYRAAFERYLRIVDWLPGCSEGRQYLTPQIRAELSDYSEVELLTRNIIVIARRRED